MGSTEIAGQVIDVAEKNVGQINKYIDMLGTWAFSMAGKLLVAIIILLIGKKFIKFVLKLMEKALDKGGVEISLAKFLRQLAEIGLYGLLFFVIAGQLGINTASIVALLGTVGLALSLALQGSLANFAGGVMILLMKPFRVGDYIVSDQGEGTVSSIGLFYTRIVTVDNKGIMVPNGALSNSAITNVSAYPERRVDVSVGIGYGADIKLAKKLFEKVYADLPYILKDKEITIFVDELADSAVVLGGRGWVKAENYWTAKWEVTENVKLVFDEHGIEIPFNQLDVHVDGLK